MGDEDPPEPPAQRVLSAEILLADRQSLPEDSVLLVDLGDEALQPVTVLRQGMAGAQPPVILSLDAPANGDLLLRAGFRSPQGQIWLSEPLTVPAGTEDADLGVIRASRTGSMGFATLLRCGTQVVEFGLRTDGARMRLGGRSIDLVSDAAASGTRYIAPDQPGTFVWTHQDSATVAIEGLTLSECAIAPAGQIITDTVWRIARIEQGLPVADAVTELVFWPDGRLSGSAGCNRLIASYARHGNILSIGQIAGTRMACDPTIMEQERQVLALLERIDGYALDTEKQTLVLSIAAQPVLELVHD